MSNTIALDLLVQRIVDTQLGFETIDGCCLPSIRAHAVEHLQTHRGS
jgi:hypothetical protein